MDSSSVAMPYPAVEKISQFTVVLYGAERLQTRLRASLTSGAVRDDKRNKIGRSDFIAPLPNVRDRNCASVRLTRIRTDQRIAVMPMSCFVLLQDQSELCVRCLSVTSRRDVFSKTRTLAEFFRSPLSALSFNRNFVGSNPNGGLKSVGIASGDRELSYFQDVSRVGLLERSSNCGAEGAARALNSLLGGRIGALFERVQ